MKYSLMEFSKGLEDLEYYVDGIYKHRELFNKLRHIEKESAGKLEDKPLLSDTKELLTQYFHTTNKVFEYNSIIVSLYGLLENFIESLIKEYIEYLGHSIPKYNELPQNIINNHYELSANLINNLKFPKYKDLISKETIVSNLYSCLDCRGVKNYTVNTEAFTHHPSNFRDKSINQFFKTVGIINATGLILSNKVFKEFLEEIGIELLGLVELDTEEETSIVNEKGNVAQEDENESENQIVKEKQNKAFEILNDLAERRNKVSHGSVVEDILNIEELSRYINYIKVFVECLNTVVFEQAIPHILMHGDNKIEIGKPIKRFTDNIVGLGISGSKIAVNSTVFIIKSDGTYMYSKIQSLRIGDTDYSEIDATTERYEVGVCFDRKVKENYTFYLILDNNVV